jgi:divalent metal cation (Fe/Co/Zn/Cd) transporter
VSRRTAQRYQSPALGANALHFAGDFAGSLAVLLGLALVRLGYPQADSIAALLVAVLVLVAAGRLMYTNIHTLMDRAPDDASARARRAIERVTPEVELRRLRMREAAGHHFADVVIGVPPAAGVGQGHALADEVEQAIERAVPGSDVVVHVEPRDAHPSLRERVLAAASQVPDVREIHNLEVLQTEGQTEVSLHLKLPRDMDLDRAHQISHAVERAIIESVDEVDDVQTHIEPLKPTSPGATADPSEVAEEREAIERIVRERTGAEPREVRFVHTDRGLVAFLTLGVGSDTSLSHAHDLASEVELQVRADFPHIADVVVHTEP